MPDITLHYFDVRGRGEIIRMVLTYAGQNFNDHRLTFDEWPTFKSKTPLGSLPVLEMDGQMFTQSGPIAMYFAEEYGLHGSNNVEALEIDALLMNRDDIIMEEGKYLYAENDAKKEEQGKKLGMEVYPKYLTFLCKMLSQNKKKTGTNFAIGSSFSLADIIIYEGTQNMIQHFPSIIHAYPDVKEHRSFVEKNDRLKEYIKDRQEFPM